MEEHLNNVENPEVATEKAKTEETAAIDEAAKETLNETSESADAKANENVGEEKIENENTEKQPEEEVVYFRDTEFIDKYPDFVIDEEDIVKVVISGYYGFNNIGDEAVLMSIIQKLKNTIRGVEIIVLSNNPEETARLYDVKACDRWNFKEITKAIQESKILISGGGSLLQDVTSIKNVIYYLAIIQIALRNKKKVLVYSQGIGPLNKAISRVMVKHTLNKVSGIYVRDRGSAMLLRSIGVKNVDESIDPVLGLQTSSTETPTPVADKSIGVFIRPWKNDDKIVQDMTLGLANMVKKGYKLYFIPMYFEQDLEISKKLEKMVIQKLAEEEVEPNTETLEAPLTIAEVVAYIKKFNMVVGMRLHSLIIAAANGIPMVGVSYDPKVVNFLKEIEVDTFVETDHMSSSEFNREMTKVERYQEKLHNNLEYARQIAQARLNLPVRRLIDLACLTVWDEQRMIMDPVLRMPDTQTVMFDPERRR